MTWLYITIIAYLLFALANVGDKLMVSKYKTKPVVYAFYVGILGIVTLVLIPFGVIWPGLSQLFWSLIGGLAFVIALYTMYIALESGPTTKAITLLGGSSPIFTYFLSMIFLGEELGVKQIVAFIFLVVAIIVISWELNNSPRKINKKLVFWGIAAGFVFASSFVLARYVYLNQEFISGFVWIRIGGFLTALALLLIPGNYNLIKKDFKKPKKQKGSLLFAVQVLGGLGVIGQNYAFSLTSATIVNALQAIQYAFVFILTTIFGYKIKTIKEQHDYKEILQKIIAIILIGIGLYLLAI